MSMKILFIQIVKHAKIYKIHCQKACSVEKFGAVVGQP